jgi:hypothetical protein
MRNGRNGSRSGLRRASVALFALSLAVSVAVAAGPSGPARAADQQYTSQVSQSVQIPTRSGDTLTVDLTFPAIDGQQAPGQFPVVACLCYITNVDTNGLDVVFPGQASAYARAGYVAATVHVAGSGTSEGGPWNMSDPTWQQDNYDAIEWLGTQPWSTGKVGTFGESGNGMSQIFTAQNRPPHLTTAIIAASGADSYDTLMPGGMISLQIALFACGIPGALTTALNGIPVPGANAALPQLTPEGITYLIQQNIKKYTEGKVVPFCPVLDGWYNHQTRDAFWTGDPLAKIQNITIPVWAWSGWDDIFVRAIPNLYTGLGSSQKMLAMGLNSHEAPGGGDGFDPTAEALQWFDHFLKGEDNGITAQLNNGRFRYYVNGAWQWKSASTYPIPGTVYTPFYLDTGASGPLATGSLATTTPTRAGADGYSYTPASAVAQAVTGLTQANSNLVNPFEPNNAANDTILNNTMTSGDQRLEVGPSTVVYETAPLTQDVEVTGPITATLFAQTTSPDTDFVFKVSDVNPTLSLQTNVPPGFWKYVTSGNLKGTFRTYANDYASESPIPTNTPVRYDIQGYPTSYLFKKGHRIAITIESSNMPRLLANLNPANVTILHGPQYPSQVTLPIIPAGL